MSPLPLLKSRLKLLNPPQQLLKLPLPLLKVALLIHFSRRQAKRW